MTQDQDLDVASSIGAIITEREQMREASALQSRQALVASGLQDEEVAGSRNPSGCRRQYEQVQSLWTPQGTTVYMEEKAAVLMKLNFTVTDWAEAKTLTFRMVSGNFVRAYEQRWTLEPAAAGTRFTLAEDVTMPYGPLGRLLGAFGRSSSERHVGEILAKLKALAEAAA